jgi:hypothetical protein
LVETFREGEEQEDSKERREGVGDRREIVVGDRERKKKRGCNSLLKY